MKCHFLGILLSLAQSHDAKTANKRRIKVNEGIGLFISRNKITSFFLSVLFVQAEGFTFEFSPDFLSGSVQS